LIALSDWRWSALQNVGWTLALRPWSDHLSQEASERFLAVSQTQMLLVGPVADPRAMRPVHYHSETNEFAQQPQRFALCKGLR